MANMPDPEDYDKKLEAMTVCATLELGLNELHEAATSALYIMHMYNPTVVESFLGVARLCTRVPYQLW